MNSKAMGSGIDVEICTGTAIGAATGNLGMWIAIGIAIGVGLAPAFSSQSPKEEVEE